MSRIDDPVHPNEYAYWRHENHAAGFSKAVAEAAIRLTRVRKEVHETLQREYPHGAAVRVYHSRGTFTGTVTGWTIEGYRVKVLNDESGKTNGWWAAQVELVQEADRG